MRVVSVNLDRPTVITHGGRRYRSPINRRPVDGGVELIETGLAGDHVSDLENHGGVD